MKNTFCSLLYIISLAILLWACSSEVSIDNITQPASDLETHTKQSTIFNLSELEIIKKSADYFKSLGETITFTESLMTILNSEDAPLTFQDSQGKYIQHTGNYMLVKLFKEPDQQEDFTQCYTIYLAEDGSILYTEKNVAK
jgi:hypothetical protein